MIPLSEPLPNITPLHAVSTDHSVYNRSPGGIYTCCPVQSRAKRHEKNEWRIPGSTPIFLHATQTNQPPYLKENTICCVYNRPCAPTAETRAAMQLHSVHREARAVHCAATWRLSRGAPHAEPAPSLRKGRQGANQRPFMYIGL